MFREMRRKRQQLPDVETVKIMSEATSGVLALSGDDDYPYAVPLSFLFKNNKLYFHCAASGKKLDAVRRNSKASFCVIAKDSVYPEKYTTKFRSVIAFGKITVLEDEREIRLVLEEMGKKYAPDDTEIHRQKYIDQDISRVCVMKMDIEHMTGKEAIELVRERTEE